MINILIGADPDTDTGAGRPLPPVAHSPSPGADRLHQALKNPKPVAAAPVLLGEAVPGDAAGPLGMMEAAETVGNG